ncbi:DUF2937 family protein [Photobacterium halotolerans]|uniref:DUF2937 family protein n=1 Tax=Photobacterium halotolerans TaxID=265726 RepID=UPI000428E300|nr:DUF2937 family protein [Photobacterium halotolerans]
MVGRIVDKLLFGVMLIAALQVPLLADHYQQYLAGLFEATQWQVKGYENTARQYGYPDVNAMIEQHLDNQEASVRADALQKQATLSHYQDLKAGLAVFEQGTLIEKSVYMFTPARFDALEKTLTHFKPGIPLSLNGLMFGAILGLAANILLTLPFSLLFRRKRRAMLAAKRPVIS